MELLAAKLHTYHAGVETLVRYGPGALSVAELLAIVFNIGTKKEEVLQMASRLLKEYGERAVLDQKDPHKISGSLGIPLGKSCQLIACFELGRRFFKSANGRPEFLRQPNKFMTTCKICAISPKSI